MSGISRSTTKGSLAHDRYKDAASWVVKLDREPLGRAAPPNVSPRMRDPEGMQGR